MSTDFFRLTLGLIFTPFIRKITHQLLFLSIYGNYGLTTSFAAGRIKPGVVVLGSDETIGVVKYLHGQVGEGSFTFLGGHDPEDPQHLVGDQSTDLDLNRNSAGYRLILNNVLYPAARKKALKT